MKNRNTQRNERSNTTKEILKKQTEIIGKRDEIFLVEKQYTFIQHIHAIIIFNTQLQENKE